MSDLELMVLVGIIVATVFTGLYLELQHAREEIERLREFPMETMIKRRDSEIERLREALEQAYTDGGFTPDEVAEMLADLKGEQG